MRAVYYDRPGPARDVLVCGHLPDPEPGPGEVLVELSHSGVNPGDVKKRADAFGLGMSYPRIIPHSDGAGRILAVGPGVAASRRGERVWLWGAQTYRPEGTAAEAVAIPSERTVSYPDSVDPQQAACLGIAGMTAHEAVFAFGPVAGRTVLINGAAGAVGLAAAQLATAAGARVVATVRRDRDAELVRAHCAAQLLLLRDTTAAEIRSLVPDGVDHIVEVALDANAALDAAVVKQGGTIAAYSSGAPEPSLPFWPLLFANVTLRLLGSDDFSADARRRAAETLTATMAAGTLRFPITAVLPLAETPVAHELVERPAGRGKVLVAVR